eukprot:NODE_320_length_1671_cov_297.080446.p1 GENE.NODE_320_length_1671_cov_297.080446~~NODE_320_length_1671_cov_297.080446.p1  ORF type:complete len:497 (+),score=139.92 NODE_320_length_1671_cov_297.080446:3-1493(+)
MGAQVSHFDSSYLSVKEGSCPHASQFCFVPSVDPALLSASMPPDRLIEFFNDADGFFAGTVGAIVRQDATLYIAVLLVLQGHARHCFADYRWVQAVNNVVGRPGLICHRLSLDVWILQLYYHPKMPLASWVKGRVFVSTVALIAFDAVVVGFGFRILARHVSKKCKPDGCAPVDPEVGDHEEALEALNDPRVDNDDPDGDEADMADSMYMDVAEPLRKAFTMAIIQLSLLFLYIFKLNTDPDTKNPLKAKYGYWFIAIVLQLYAADSQLGNSTNIRWWRHLLGFDKTREEPKGESELEKQCVVIRKERQADLADIRKLWRTRCGCIRTTYGFTWQLRFLCDFAVNGVARQLILFTFPIMLCVEEPLDVVKDCTAVFFMTMLDDVKEPRTWNELMVKLKFTVAKDELDYEMSGAKSFMRSNCDLLGVRRGNAPVKFTEHEKTVIKQELKMSVNGARRDRFETQRKYKVKAQSFLAMLENGKWPEGHLPEEQEGYKQV